MDEEKLLNYAHILGAEARANQKAFLMTADDRKDLIHTSSVSKWGDLSDEITNELQSASYAGFQSESENYFSRSTTKGYKLRSPPPKF